MAKSVNSLNPLEKRFNLFTKSAEAGRRDQPGNANLRIGDRKESANQRLAFQEIYAVP
jgi:hypothetical protein